MSMHISEDLKTKHFFLIFIVKLLQISVFLIKYKLQNNGFFLAIAAAKQDSRIVGRLKLLLIIEQQGFIFFLRHGKFAVKNLDSDPFVFLLPTDYLKKISNHNNSERSQDKQKLSKPSAYQLFIFILN